MMRSMFLRLLSFVFGNLLTCLISLFNFFFVYILYFCMYQSCVVLFLFLWLDLYINVWYFLLQILGMSFNKSYDFIRFLFINNVSCSCLLLIFQVGNIILTQRITSIPYIFFTFLAILLILLCLDSLHYTLKFLLITYIFQRITRFEVYIFLWTLLGIIFAHIDEGISLVDFYNEVAGKCTICLLIIKWKFSSN